MSFESIYKMSVVMSMIDNMSAPMKNTSKQTQDTISKLDSMSQTFGNMTQLGSASVAIGREITEGVLAPVEATWNTKQALGELASLGVKDLETIEAASKSFSDQWSGTTKADFITAAYDIKSGIALLTDAGVADYTRLAGLTATATKASVGDMTSLFATGYGIYKNYYSELSDLEFGQMFSAGISASVKQFKTTGSSVAAAIQNLGAAATTANVPMEEQLAILGMLQGTMSGSEAGTKYKAFLRSAVKGGEELGLSFLDANNNLKSMPEILDQLIMKFGDTMDAAEKLELQKAFGDTEAVQLIDLMYSKVGDLQSNIIGLYGSMQTGESAATEMANAINDTDPSKYEILKQKLHNVAETIGNSVQPKVDKYLGKASNLIDKAGEWIENHQTLVSWLMQIMAVIGISVMVCGGFITVIGGVGLIFTKTGSLLLLFGGNLAKLPGMFETLQIKALYAGDMVHLAFSKIRSGGSAAINGIGNVVRSIISFAKTAAISGVIAAKNFVFGMAGMARQAITTAVTTMPGLIASVWSFTTALLANPITWIVIGIVALIAALIALYKNWDTVVAFVKNIFWGFVNGIREGFDWIAEKFHELPQGLQIVIAAIFPFIGIPLLIKNNWGTISGFFGSLWTKVHEKFTGGIRKIKDFFNGLPEWFRESGKKVIETFASGIMSVITSPATAVQKGLQKIRNLLPFSDAKEGPLSTLTLSGQRMLETVSTGIDTVSELPAERVQESLGKIGLSGKKLGKISLTGGNIQGDTSADKERGVTIQKLFMNVSFKEIEELRKLKKLLEDIENYTNSSTEFLDDDFTPEPA